MEKVRNSNEEIRHRPALLDNVERSESMQLVRRNYRRGSGPRPRPPPTYPEKTGDYGRTATLSINPADAPDLTSHLSLDLHGDLENTLEEISRLRRLGHFKNALSLAEAEIKPFLHNRYVLLQYAQLLMDAKRYKDIARLRRDYEPVKNSSSLIELNWEMICQLAEITTELDIVGCERVRRSPEYEGGPLDSTLASRCSMLDPTQEY
ncbi:hypothetical protein B0I35DRAFT_413365 [Stachybotrys elegans]|uniref:Uncharacterized protein n=1 Tax=Stachybotrys elegans TaxID=80388 RepID=A0A8K0SH25_9HYPO|nr:hypothetical protein B0I35DRAFT_413365 [Stachybotrys elegans]